jgi:hypothetical protein
VWAEYPHPANFGHFLRGEGTPPTSAVAQLEARWHYCVASGVAGLGEPGPKSATPAKQTVEINCSGTLKCRRLFPWRDDLRVVRGPHGGGPSKLKPNPRTPRCHDGAIRSGFIPECRALNRALAILRCLRCSRARCARTGKKRRSARRTDVRVLTSRPDHASRAAAGSPSRCGAGSRAFAAPAAPAAFAATPKAGPA